MLDALDECDRDKRRKVVEVFDCLIKDSAMPVKIFISSRPDGDIKKRLVHPSNIEILANDNQNDISKYIKKEIVNHERWHKMNDPLRNDIVATLQAQSGGMYVFTIKLTLQICLISIYQVSVGVSADQAAVRRT